MIFPILTLGFLFIVMERIIPDQNLPSVKGWWLRVVIINLFQLGIVILSMVTIDPFFQSQQAFKLNILPTPINGFISYIILTFIFYWWHRWRHDIRLFWNLFHQVHHSPQRIETITSFYKHPVEIMVNSIIIGCINFLLLGLSVEAAAWCLFYASLGEYFYHMNIKTPYKLGYFFQRPEMHRIHHQRGKHYQNFSDIPLWDICFGTFNNPKSNHQPCGFEPKREKQLLKMLLFRNINEPVNVNRGLNEAKK